MNYYTQKIEKKDKDGNVKCYEYTRKYSTKTDRKWCIVTREMELEILEATNKKCSQRKIAKYFNISVRKIKKILDSFNYKRNKIRKWHRKPIKRSQLSPEDIKTIAHAVRYQYCYKLDICYQFCITLYTLNKIIDSIDR